MRSESKRGTYDHLKKRRESSYVQYGLGVSQMAIVLITVTILRIKLVLDDNDRVLCVF